MRTREIPEDLLKIVIDYVASGSVATERSWSEIRTLLLRLEQLKPVPEPAKEEE